MAEQKFENQKRPNFSETLRKKFGIPVTLGVAGFMLGGATFFSKRQSPRDSLTYAQSTSMAEEASALVAKLPKGDAKFDPVLTHHLTLLGFRDSSTVALYKTLYILDRMDLHPLQSACHGRLSDKEIARALFDLLKDRTVSAGLKGSLMYDALRVAKRAEFKAERRELVTLACQALDDHFDFHKSSPHATRASDIRGNQGLMHGAFWVLDSLATTEDGSAETLGRFFNRCRWTRLDDLQKSAGEALDSKIVPGEVRWRAAVFAEKKNYQKDYAYEDMRHRALSTILLIGNKDTAYVSQVARFIAPEHMAEFYLKLLKMADMEKTYGRVSQELLNECEQRALSAFNSGMKPDFATALPILSGLKSVDGVTRTSLLNAALSSPSTPGQPSR
jgi:hypothetical protein